MTGILRPSLAALLLLAGMAGAPPRLSSADAADTCDSLGALVIPGVSIDSARAVVAGPFAPAPGARAATVPPFCRVSAVAAPSADSHINIEVWIPSPEGWNGKLLGTANGGFSGSIPYPAMLAGLTKGYAVVGTDTGHTGDQMEFGQGHPEKVIDWAYRAVHVMTDLAKLIVRDARGRFPTRSYFEGCSTGGQQALSEAQRFPRDYDGIVAGDPGHNRIRLILGFLWSWMALHDDEGRQIVPPAKLPAITAAAIAACDVNDGLKDGLISDPRACQFDPRALLCRGSEDNACLTAAQADAVKKVYDGAENPRTHQLLYPGWARGTEQGWGTYLLNPTEPMRLGLFRYFVFDDPQWHWRTFDWDRDVRFIEDQVPFVSAASADLRAFRTHGGRLVMYTGLADPVVPPQDIYNYYDAVTKAMGGSLETEKFFRFFPVPGMGHCGGGAGPNAFDALGALEAWVEHDVAPERIVASHSTNGRVDRTRPLCPYPRVARFKGTGSIDAAENFVCAAKGITP
jgi:feruloyl esterase